MQINIYNIAIIKLTNVYRFDKIITITVYIICIVVRITLIQLFNCDKPLSM